MGYGMSRGYPGLMMLCEPSTVLLLGRSGQKEHPLAGEMTQPGL